MNKSMWFLGVATACLSLAVVGCNKPKYPACKTDGDCHQSEFCVQQQCQQCRTDADCGAGNQCVAGRCDPIPNYCQSDTQCGEGMRCNQQRCEAQPTSSTQPSGTSTQAPTCTLEPIYFAFDQSDLTQQSRDALAADARCIGQRGVTALHITGYTDPRGTEEYNLALGDRRARAAKSYLVSLGVNAGVTVSSMGEEMATGTDEAGWAHDRRAELTEK